jgi:hypothetical protein
MARRITLGTVGPSDVAPIITNVATPVPMSASQVGAVAAAVVARRVCTEAVRVTGIRVALLDSGDAAEVTTVQANRIPAGSGTATVITGSAISLSDALLASQTLADSAPVSQDFEIGDTIEIEVTAAGTNATDVSVSLVVMKLYGDA